MPDVPTEHPAPPGTKISPAGLPPDPSIGLRADQVAERRRAGQTNDLPSRTSRSYAEIVRSNTLTFFNAMFGSLAVVMLAVAPPQDAIFGLIVLANTAVGIVQEIRAKWTLDRLAVLGQARPRVVRDGVLGEVDRADVVLDDVVDLSVGDQVVVDGAVLVADGLEVDESLLTGESDPVAKQVGDPLSSGSFVVAGSGRGVATRVGRSAYAARLVDEASSFTLAGSRLRADLDRFLRAITWVLVPTAVLLMSSQLLRSGLGVRPAIAAGIAGTITMVPEGLILLTSIAFAVGVVRLGRRRVLVQELAAVEGLARTDVLCIDKTGTLTDPRLSVVGVESSDPAAPVAQALAALAAAEHHPNLSLVAIAEAYPQDPGWVVREQVGFSSARGWSGAWFDDQGGWVLGGADRLLDPDLPLAVRAEELAGTGQRVLALARTGQPPPTRSGALPTGLVPSALVVLDQPLRPDAAATLRYFAEQ
ncbi:MAG: HAD-IC family P-type ATPase, partial [Actinomycetes bacterium]